ncbi:HNH endonuclease [Mycobacterium phage JeTaime]|nr:HNH endonuclease [Mycobacterium phage JeTaime]
MATLERWLPIEGYEGCYEVSDQGRVRSLERLNARGARVRERILTPMLCGRPKYHMVALHRDGVRNVRKVHHLVLEAFVGPRLGDVLCRHKNDIPTDNRLSNLAWGTGSENQHDSVRNGRHAQSRKVKCRNSHPLSGDNLYVTPAGERACRECNRQAAHRYIRRAPRPERAT